MTITRFPGQSTPDQRQEEAKRAKRRLRARALRKPHRIGPTERVILMLRASFDLETFQGHDNDNPAGANYP